MLRAMCCFVLTLGLLGPRAAFLATWLFTDRVQFAFSGGVFVPLLGLIFLPWTALAYTFAWTPVNGVSALGWAVVGLGFVLDVATYSSRAAGRRYNSRSASLA